MCQHAQFKRSHIAITFCSIERGLGGKSKISELVAVVTFVMMGVQWSWVHREEDGHWLALVQRPSHQPHSVTRDAIRQEVQVVS